MIIINLHSFTDNISFCLDDEVAKNHLDLVIEDPGRLLESALLQLAVIKKMKAQDLLKYTAGWWQKLHEALNNPVLI